MQTVPVQKINSLQTEIKALKNISKTKTKKKSTEKSLFGILKGTKISWKEFQEAKKAIFAHSQSHLK